MGQEASGARVTWKHWLGFAGALLAVAALAFSAGRYTAPLHTEVTEVEKVVWKDREVEKVVTVEVAAKAEQRTVYVDRVIRDGEVHEQVIEHWNTVEASGATTTADKEVTSEGTKEVEKVVTTTLRPDWRVAVLAGGTLQKPLIPIGDTPLVFGAEIDRRILGGVSAGVWFNTSGAAGVAVSLEF